MFLLFLLVLVSALDFPSNVLDNYSNFNANTIRATIERGTNYTKCISWIRNTVLNCVFNPNLYSGLIEPPNTCHLNLVRGMYPTADCEIPLTTIGDIVKELQKRQFGITFTLQANENITFTQLQSVGLMPDSMIITW
jgi:hypothetical protein